MKKNKIEPKYLEVFKKLAASDIPLRGNRLLIEILPPVEVHTKGGLVVATSLADHRSTVKDNAADVGVVLAVGSGYYNENGDSVPLDIEVGNVVLITRYGLRLYSVFPGLDSYVADTIALARDSDIHAAWKDIASFETYSEKLRE